MIERNEGVVVSGGNVHIGANAQGPGAQATQNITHKSVSADDLRTLAHTLVESLRQHPGQVDGVTLSAAEQTADALDEERPDLPRVKRLLATVTAGAGAVAAAATAATALEQAVTGLL